MSEEETKELKRLARRVAELEAAHGLRGMAPANEDQETLADVCKLAGLGVRTIQGKSQARDVVEKRRVVVKTLRKNLGWTIKRVAAALDKSERTIERM